MSENKLSRRSFLKKTPELGATVALGGLGGKAIDELFERMDNGELISELIDSNRRKAERAREVINMLLSKDIPPQLIQVCELNLQTVNQTIERMQYFGEHPSDSNLKRAVQYSEMISRIQDEIDKALLELI